MLKETDYFNWAWSKSTPSPFLRKYEFWTLPSEGLFLSMFLHSYFYLTKPFVEKNKEMSSSQAIFSSNLAELPFWYFSHSSLLYIYHLLPPEKRTNYQKISRILECKNWDGKGCHTYYFSPLVMLSQNFSGSQHTTLQWKLTNVHLGLAYSKRKASQFKL